MKIVSRGALLTTIVSRGAFLTAIVSRGVLARIANAVHVTLYSRVTMSFEIVLHKM